jgi:hypothetical protein
MMTAQQDQIQQALQALSTETDEPTLLSHLQVLLIAVDANMNITMDRHIIQLLERTDNDAIIEFCCKILDKITVDLQPETVSKALQSIPAIQKVTLANID